MRIFLALILLVCSAQSAMAQAFDYSYFEQIPVLHEGRVKPLDSFARIYQKRFSGDENQASAWLAETLFDPTAAVEQKIFLIRDKTLKAQFDLSEEDKLFSYTDLQPGLEKAKTQLQALLLTDPKLLTADQSHFLELHDNIAAFMHLMRSFSLLLPLNIELPAGYDVEASRYLDLVKIQPQLTADLKEVVQRKGQDLDTYTEDEQKLAQASFHLQMFQYAGENNNLLRVLPSSEEWVSPWAVLLSGQGSPENRSYLSSWSKVAEAYRNKNADQFTQQTRLIFEQISQLKNLSFTKVKIEKLYNQVKPFHVALALYVLSVFSCLVLLFKPSNIVQQLSFWTLGAGSVIHAFAIGVRVFLLDRPPVGTLYESIVFVALICTLFCFVTAFRSRQTVLVFSGALVGAGLLAIAPALISQGESMELLVAVLNTNFWLSTHVLCITAGYGVSILAAMFAHGYLGLRAFAKNRNLFPNLLMWAYRLSIAALLLTAVGTALGGIWADQSWGRFWGWDPKENGALLIVLWLVWVQHGRIGGKLRAVPFAALTAYLNVIVALAWFGVNLLSVGLHSYGFTDGIALSLGGFVAFETILILSLWFFIRLKEYKSHVA